MAVLLPLPETVAVHGCCGERPPSRPSGRSGRRRWPCSLMPRRPPVWIWPCFFTLPCPGLRRRVCAARCRARTRPPARARRACRAFLSRRPSRRPPRRRAAGAAKGAACRSTARRRHRAVDGSPGPVLEHEAGDLTATVEAGSASRRSNAARRPRPDARARSAGRPDGRRVSRRQPLRPAPPRYGEPRDLVLGVTVVLADGTVATPAGRWSRTSPATTSAGSSAGPAARLGLIARASLRLHPRPAAARTLGCPWPAGRGRSRGAGALPSASSLVPIALCRGRGGDRRRDVLLDGDARRAVCGPGSSGGRALVGGGAGRRVGVWAELPPRPEAQAAKSRRPGAPSASGEFDPEGVLA